MGKYLDMVRKFEERRQAEGRTEPQEAVSPNRPLNLKLTKSTNRPDKPDPTPNPTKPARPTPATVTKSVQPAQPGNRDFLSRPIGQEDNPDVWSVWTPLMLWLLEHHRARYDYLCRTEEILRALEEDGDTESELYYATMKELTNAFIAARRLAMEAQVKVWVQ
jgi:hypothetical protein